jgi:hypothetical protein
VSEDAALTRFEPRLTTGMGLSRREDGAIVPTPKSDVEGIPLVWAVDTRHLPLFWFPRDCPRGTFWARTETSDADVERFLDGDRTRRVHAIEAAWLDRIRRARVYAYRLPEASFRPHATVGGYWVSEAAVEATERVDLGDLLARHADAGIELRVVPTIWPLWDRVIASTLEFSGIRLRNAGPRPYRPSLTAEGIAAGTPRVQSALRGLFSCSTVAGVNLRRMAAGDRGPGSRPMRETASHRRVVRTRQPLHRVPAVRATRVGPGDEAAQGACVP